MEPTHGYSQSEVSAEATPTETTLNPTDRNPTTPESQTDSQCQRQAHEELIREQTAGITRRTPAEEAANIPEPPNDWNPTMPCDWLGSNFDAAGPRPGCVRHAALNARIMSHSDKGTEDQEALWQRLYELQTGIVGLSDVALQNCTVSEPRGSLFRSTQIARRSWKCPDLTMTHAQGRPGVMRDVVGGNLLAFDAFVSSILGKTLNDPRDWGRWAGRKLIGTAHKSILTYQLYFPTFANESHPGSAWQTQANLMSTIPPEDRQQDPWLQALTDLSSQIAEDIASESRAQVEGTMVIITGDFNARWVTNQTGSPQSRARTAALRHFAETYGLSEIITTIFPGIAPITFVASDAPGARTSWIDHALASTELLTDGFITEAGILLHEKLNDSDHRMYMFEIDIANALQIGPEWARRPEPDPRLPKLNIRSEEHVSQYQQRVCAQAKRLKLLPTQERAEEMVRKWHVGEATDEETLEAIENLHDTSIALLVGSWRTVAGFLPSLHQTGGSRKNIWSQDYVDKAREFRVLQDITSMWERQYPKECIIARLQHAKAFNSVAATAPTLACDHVTWRDWVAAMRIRAKEKRKELHASWRTKARESMLGAIKARSDNFLAGAQRSAISSWLNRSRRTPPMRSIQTLSPEGSPMTTTEPTKLKALVDGAFQERASGGYGPSKWYEGHAIDATTPEGLAMRIALAELGIAGIDTQGIPPHLHEVLDEAQRKYIDSLGGPASSEPYDARGCMQPMTQEAFTQYWAHRKKGTSPGQSQLSVNLVWALQRRVQQSQSTKKANEKKAQEKPPSKERHQQQEAEKECLTMHCFDALRVLCNLILSTALIPAGMLRSVLCLLDKAAGCHKMTNKRPIGLVEQLTQATLGPQFQIIEDVWEEHSMIDTFQSGGSRNTGCDVPVMSVTAKMEHAWIYKHYLALVWQDQSKAFEAMHLHLGQEIPMRRLGVPESFLRLHKAFKVGSWVMVQTAWGPREVDWQCVMAHLEDGINVMKDSPTSPDDPEFRQIGFHDTHGTTQGGAGGTTTYRAQYDWFATLQRRLQKSPAPYSGPDGKDLSSAGHGFVDDVCLTTASERGAISAVMLSRNFNELQDGAFNVDKTKVSIADFQPCGTKYKMKCGPDETFDSRHHIPDVITIPNESAMYEIQTLEAQLAASADMTDQAQEATLLLIETLKAQLTLTIPVLDPYEPILYLGVWMSPAMYYHRALEAATACTDLAAAAIQTTAIKPKEAQEIARMVPQAQAVYKLKCTSLLPEQMPRVDTKLRAAVKTKSGLCKTFANHAFHGTLYEGIHAAVLAERIMLTLRLIHLRNPVSELMRGSLWRYQRWLGTSTPALEYEHAELIGWEGTWISSLAIWLSRTSLTITGGEGIKPLCTTDACLVDLAPLESKATVAEWCRTHEIWRTSELSDSTGNLRTECQEGGAWDDDSERVQTVTQLYELWRDAHPNGSNWKHEIEWDAGAILEHGMVASNDGAGEPRLGRAIEYHRHAEHPRLTVQWLQRVPRAQAYELADVGVKCWFDAFGGKGHQESTPRRRSQRVNDACPDQARRRTTNPWSKWVWGEATAEHTVIPISEVTPICTSKRLATFCGETTEITVIAESAAWGSGARWTQSTDAWQPNTTLVAGTHYTGTTLAQDQVHRRQHSWDDTVAEATTASVLYGYSDCSKVKIGPRQVLSYGWLTAGLASTHCIEEQATGGWSLVQSDDDFHDLRPGLWGGAIVQGPQKELTTYRGEALGALGLIMGVRAEGFIGRLMVTLDNKAVVDNFNGRGTAVAEPNAPGPQHRLTDRACAPCLDDLADSDVWMAMDAERRLWGNRLRMQWGRSHPEKRKAKAAWSRHEHANSWADLQADDIRDADPRGTKGLSDKVKLAPDTGPGAWGIAWQGERVITSVNKAIRAALKADAFANYLREKRGWSVEAVGAFSRERWTTRLATLRNMANATVITKMITGWLASQSVLIKRNQAALTPEQAYGTCRMCGQGAESNWHVQAECTHPDVVAERRAASDSLQSTIKNLNLPAGAAQLLCTNWLLDSEGRAHDLSDVDLLATLLQEWAPDVSLRAQQVQETLHWTCTQGAWKDNLRKWSFRGIMLDHWVTALTELGCSPADAKAALTEVEIAIMKTVPGIWNVFSAGVHEANGADSAREALEADIEAFFQDWARDQGPIPVTRSYVQTLTARAKRKWLAKRKKELKKKRSNAVAASSGHSSAVLITRYLAVVPVAPELLASVQSHRYLSGARGNMRRRKKRWAQTILRDCGFEPGPRPEARDEPSRRTRQRRVPDQAPPTQHEQDTDDNPNTGDPLANPPTHEGLHHQLPTPTRTIHRQPRWGGITGTRANPLPAAEPSPSQAGTCSRDTGNLTNAQKDTGPASNNNSSTAEPIPKLTPPIPQENTQYAVYERG
jgi:hypothetical protein